MSDLLIQHEKLRVATLWLKKQSHSEKLTKGEQGNEMNEIINQLREENAQLKSELEKRSPLQQEQVPSLFIGLDLTCSTHRMDESQISVWCLSSEDAWQLMKMIDSASDHNSFALLQKQYEREKQRAEAAERESLVLLQRYGDNWYDGFIAAWEDQRGRTFGSIDDYSKDDILKMSEQAESEYLKKSLSNQPESLVSKLTSELQAKGFENPQIPRYAKAGCIGEFKFTIEEGRCCPECWHEKDDDCHMCNGQSD